MNAQKYFGTTNLYKILELDRNSQISEGNWIDIDIGFKNSFIILLLFFKVKKNYYRLALIHHPDRVNDNEKATAKEKFTILHQAYVILSNIHERQLYDDGSDIMFGKATKSAEWEHFLKPTTDTEINNARLRYQNSSEEENDIRREFQAGGGSMTHILNRLPFMRIDDESRIVNIIKRLTAAGKIPVQKIKKIAKK